MRQSSGAEGGLRPSSTSVHPNLVYVRRFRERQKQMVGVPLSAQVLA